MGRRLTDYPLKLHFDLTESSANTFTPGVIDTPVGQLSSSGKVQAMEVMNIFYDIRPPSFEASAANSAEVAITTQLVATALLEKSNPDVLWMQTSLSDVIGAGTPGERKFKTHLMDQIHDGDGAGELVYNGTLHIQILGTGNASAGFVRGYIQYHLVEVSAKDVVQDILSE